MMNNVVSETFGFIARTYKEWGYGKTVLYCSVAAITLVGEHVLFNKFVPNNIEGFELEEVEQNV